MRSPIINYVALGALCIGGACSAPPTTTMTSREVSTVKTKKLDWLSATRSALENELVAEHGEVQRERIARGIEQVASFWREADGDRAVLEQLVRTNYAGDQDTLDAMFERYQLLLEKLDGHMLEMLLAFREHSDLDRGPILPFDEIFAGYNPSAHVADDFFANKLAFIVLLNFPLTTLEQRLTEGASWSRRQWAEARLAQRFAKRIPAEVQQEMSRANAQADQYIAEYNIWMHHLVDGEGQRLFPPKLRLLSHWNLRDEIKASYGDAESGLAKQRTIQRVMERIVDQSIPEVVIDNPHVDWNPITNHVTTAKAKDVGSPPPANMEITNEREPDTRYATLLATFQAARRIDEYSPTAPTHIARRFDEDREISEERVHAMFEQVLSSPLRKEVGALISKRLGRPLEPFDIWYNGFRSKGAYSQDELDAIVRERYPSPAAFQKDLPIMLEKLGFSPERAQVIAANIAVDPARGSGHAWGAAMRLAKAHLRTRVGAEGMDYKGFNIAVHEMGHNVEQTISLNDIDHTLLQGVPNTAFTEAMAFVFQARDLELLGLSAPDAESRAIAVLDDFWGTAEIAAVALVDMAVWHWMYQNPEATPAELRKATLRIAKDVWNRYFAEIFNQRDVVLLGIYSHMIHSMLYLPDYPIGHLIARQVEEKMESAERLGPEVERMVLAGRIAPDLWMQKAAGNPVGPEALLGATRAALDLVSAQED